MSRLASFTAALLLAGAASLHAQTPQSSGLELNDVQNADGLRMLVAPENTQPTLRIILSGHAASDRSIEVLFPEHVTGVEHGNNASRHLYLFRPGQAGERPQWHRSGRSLEYQCDLPGAVHLLARATLEDDGVRIHYEFTTIPRWRMT